MLSSPPFLTSSWRRPGHDVVLFGGFRWLSMIMGTHLVGQLVAAAWIIAAGIVLVVLHSIQFLRPQLTNTHSHIAH